MLFSCKLLCFVGSSEKKKKKKKKKKKNGGDKGGRGHRFFVLLDGPLHARPMTPITFLCLGLLCLWQLIIIIFVLPRAFLLASSSLLPSLSRLFHPALSVSYETHIIFNLLLKFEPRMLELESQLLVNY